MGGFLMLKKNNFFTTFLEFLVVAGISGLIYLIPFVQKTIENYGINVRFFRIGLFVIIANVLKIIRHFLKRRKT